MNRSRTTLRVRLSSLVALALLITVIGPAAASAQGPYNIQAVGPSGPLTCQLRTVWSPTKVSYRNWTVLYNSHVSCSDLMNAIVVSSAVAHVTDGVKDSDRSWCFGCRTWSAGDQVFNLIDGTYRLESKITLTLPDERTREGDPWVAWDPRLFCLPEPNLIRITCTLNEPRTLIS